MKILYFTDDFPPQSYGGAGIIAFQQARAISAKNNEVLVVTTTRNKEEDGFCCYEGLKIYKIYTDYNWRWRAYRSLYNNQTIPRVWNIIDQFKPDIIHAHNIHHYLSYHCLKLARKSGASVFLTAHDAMLFHYSKLRGKSYKVSWWRQLKEFKTTYNPCRNLIIKYYLRYTDKIFAASSVLADALRQNGIKGVEVVRNGIDADSWVVSLVAINEFRLKYNLQNKKVILFGGRLSVAKGARQAVLAMALVVKEQPAAVLLVIGKVSGYAEEMLKIAKDIGLEGNIVFTGWIFGPELKSAYEASDVVLVPSIYLDPFPTVNLEAMSCKKPVVATCLGGSRELVVDQETGYIVDPFDIKLTAERITSLLSNPNQAREMGEFGYERIKKDFDLQKVADKLIATYQLSCYKSPRYDVGQQSNE